MSKRRRKEINQPIYDEFSRLSKDEQREEILEIASLCIDGAPRSLARKIEIYLDATPDEQHNRYVEIYRRWDEKRN